MSVRGYRVDAPFDARAAAAPGSPVGMAKEICARFDESIQRIRKFLHVVARVVHGVVHKEVSYLIVFSSVPEKRVGSRCAGVVPGTQ